MDTIIPFVKCLVNEDEYQEICQSPYYQEIYVETKDGFLKHLKLSGGRHVKAPIRYNSLPKDVISVLEAKEVSKESAEVNFLPAGKIPSYFLDQIVEFFRAVSKKHRADVEAHAWIMWNQEKGYHIFVPEQVVSKAAVKFEYGTSVAAGNVFVVDIHSHNTMGAFYSGTDNNNDRMSINYSMVIGNLTEKSYSHVIRFNLYEHKITCSLADIFELHHQENFEVPVEWLNQIKQPQPQVSTFSSQTVNRQRGFVFPGTKAYPTATPPNRSRTPNAYLSDAENDFWENLSKYAYGSPIDDEDFEQQYHQEYGGKEAETAMEQIALYLEDLTDSDEGLLDVIRQAYAMLGEKGRSDLASGGF